MKYFYFIFACFLLVSCGVSKDFLSTENQLLRDELYLKCEENRTLIKKCDSLYNHYNFFIDSLRIEYNKICLELNDYNRLKPKSTRIHSSTDKDNSSQHKYDSYGNRKIKSYDIGHWCEEGEYVNYSDGGRKWIPKGETHYGSRGGRYRYNKKGRKVYF